MKKEEKTKLTYNKILQAALVEFGSKSYDSASLNTICNSNQISKGLLYHNFRSKDELYLKCVEICFQEMTIYTNNIDCNADTAKESIKIFLSKRQQFFKDNCFYAKIFFDSILNPPEHLKEKIKVLREEFDASSRTCYKKILNKTTLREGITTDLAIDYFIIFQEMFNAYFQSKEYNKNDFYTIVQQHELNLSKFLDIVLYGITINDK